MPCFLFRSSFVKNLLVVFSNAVAKPLLFYNKEVLKFLSSPSKTGGLFPRINAPTKKETPSVKEFPFFSYKHSPLHMPTDGIQQLLLLYGLGKVLHHTCLSALSHIVIKCVCRHGKNGNLRRIHAVRCMDFLCCRQPIHHRHHHIHQDYIKSARRLRTEYIHGLLSVICRCYSDSCLFQQELCNLHI